MNGRTVNSVFRPSGLDSPHSAAGPAVDVGGETPSDLIEGERRAGLANRPQELGSVREPARSSVVIEGLCAVGGCCAPGPPGALSEPVDVDIRLTIAIPLGNLGFTWFFFGVCPCQFFEHVMPSI